MGRNEFEEMIARNKIESMVADMLGEILLESEAPEDIKLGVRIIRQSKNVIIAAQEILEAFAGDPATIKASDTETLKQVLGCLDSVEVVLKQFMETNNAPNEI